MKYATHKINRRHLDMSARISRSLAFASSVLAVFLMPAVFHVILPGHGETRLTAVLAGLMVSLAMALPSFFGSWSAMALKSDLKRIPRLAMALGGTTLAVSIEPTLEYLSALGFEIPIGPPFGVMVVVALMAAVFSLLVAAIAGRVT